MNGFGPTAANGFDPANGNDVAANGFGQANGFGPVVGGYQPDNADYVTDPSGHGQLPPFAGGQAGSLPVYPGQPGTGGQYATGPQQAQFRPVGQQPGTGVNADGGQQPADAQQGGGHYKQAQQQAGAPFGPGQYAGRAAAGGPAAAG